MRHRPANGNLSTDDRGLQAEAVAAAGVYGEPEGIDGILEILGERGLPVSIELAEELERAIDVEATRRAAEAVRRIALRLEGSAAAVALRRVLAGTEGESLREAAMGAGCSHVAIWKLERKIKRRLTGG